MPPFRVFSGDAASCYHLYGDDALRYLQNQMTVPVPEPGSSQWTYGLWLNRNGRVLADSFAYAQSPDSCLVWSYDCPAGNLRDTIARNIVADDVQLSDLRGELALTMLVDYEDETLLEWIGYPLPEGKGMIEADNYFLYRCTRMGAPTMVFIGSASFQQQLHKQLRGIDSTIQVLPMDHPSRHLSRIRAGIPSIPQDIGDRNIPQEGKLELDAIDFAKGCFPGQEIMASFRKTGRLNKTLIPVQSDASIAPEFIPTDIYSGNLNVGQLTSVAPDGTTTLGLGMIRLRSVDRPLHIRMPDGSEIPLQVLNLPT